MSTASTLQFLYGLDDRQIGLHLIAVERFFIDIRVTDHLDHERASVAVTDDRLLGINKTADILVDKLQASAEDIKNLVAIGQL